MTKLTSKYIRPFFMVLPMLCYGTAFAAQSMEPTLCTPDENILFQCTLKTKLLSLCASKDFAPDRGTLQYRFGTSKKLDLVYPATPQAAAGHFFFSSTPYSGGGEAHIRFETAGYEYFLFDKVIRTSFNGPNNPEFTAGVVTRHEGKTSMRECSNAASGIHANAYEAIPGETYDDLN